MEDPRPKLPAEASPTELSTETGSPAELVLRPREGLAHFMGGRLEKYILRLLSMEEVPPEAVGAPLTPLDRFFRRDRHKHPKIDPKTYRLEVTGIKEPRGFSLEELHGLPREKRLMVMECAGNGNHLMGSAGLMAQARFEGPSLEAVLDACGGPGNATHFAFVGLDGRLGRSGYHYGLSLDELLSARALLALSINGESLPRARGFPVRLVVPGIYAMSHVKWLAEIVGKTEPHRGIHNRLVYTNKELRDGKWVRVEARWIDLKSTITCCRRSTDGWELSGWAWGGGESIARVEVTTDGGRTWHDADVQPPEEVVPDAGDMDGEDLRWAWTRFVYRWRSPDPGTYMLASRAYAPDGTTQPMKEPEHVRGHFNQVRVKWRRVEVPKL